MTQEKVFVDGLITKRNEKAPDWIIASHSVKVDDFITFLKANAKNGWVNFDTKKAGSGKMYNELNTFVPKKQGAAPVAEDNNGEVPF